MKIPTIHIRGATLAYQAQTIFTNLSIEIPAGNWIALLGPSGVGKSSLLRMMAGLTTNCETFSGEIKLDNGLPLAKQIAYMAQTDLLLPWLNVLDNVTLGMKLRNDRANQRNFLQQAKELLTAVGLNHSYSLYPNQLSGGMRQRVALVRTLMEEKPIVLMDEPFSAVDAITRFKLQALAATLLRTKTVLFITHDPMEALRLADDIYIMQGQPATLKHFAHLSSAIPREMNEPTLTELQAKLFSELTHAEESMTC